VVGRFEVLTVAWLRIEVFWDVTVLLGEQFPEFQRNVVPANNQVSFT